MNCISPFSKPIARNPARGSISRSLNSIVHWKSDKKVVVPKFIQELSRRNSVAHITEVEQVGKEADPRESSRERVAAWVPKSPGERLENIEKVHKRIDAMVGNLRSCGRLGRK